MFEGYGWMEQKVCAFGRCIDKINSLACIWNEGVLDWQ